jgi:hypothetical protein
MVIKEAVFEDTTHSRMRSTTRKGTGIYFP